MLSAGHALPSLKRGAEDGMALGNAWENENISNPSILSFDWYLDIDGRRFIQLTAMQEL